MDLNDALIKVMRDWKEDRKKLIAEFLEHLYWVREYSICIETLGKTNLEIKKWEKKIK